ncbi:MAG: ribonuclease P protein component 4 [Candidatus Hadarchaeales archaeon]
MKKDDSKIIAMERIERLLSLADEIFEKYPELADRYVKRVWRIKEKFLLKLPREMKLKFCRKCLSPWKPGTTCRVRVRRKIITITCLRCGRTYRIPAPKKCY